MTAHIWSARHMFEVGTNFIGHSVTIAVGFVLMVAGLAMGVSLVMLPLGLAVGLAGVLIFLAGVFYRAQSS